MTTFFDIDINGMDQAEVARDLKQFLLLESGQQVATLNPEMLVAARRNPAFQDVLQKTALRVADGFGVQLMARLTGQEVPDRITGMEIVNMLCALSARHNKSLFLLGGAKGQARQAARALEERYGVNVDFAHGGRIEKTDNGWRMDPSVLSKIKDAQPDVLLVALGHEKQEMWIHDHLADLQVRVAVGVGGVFAFLGNHIKRAPIWMRRLGLEWLWRFLREPRRLVRIFIAVVIFPLLALRDRL